MDGLQLADALQAVGVGARDRAVGQFFDHLRIAGGAQIVHQVLRGDAGGGKLPETVVGERDLAAVHRDQFQPGVVGEGVALSLTLRNLTENR
jgi:hypothetical protein